MTFTIDGVDFSSLVIPDSLVESFENIAQDTSGVLQNHSDYFDMVGTKFSYQISLRKRSTATAAQWDSLNEILSSPVPSHTVTVPHNQTTWTFDAHISGGSRSLLAQLNGRNVWGDITINLTPISPQKEA